jgi:anti-sigma regulatory factor (Ser/Thr protein kinase)
VVGDVTDKGVPAALVMATTRTMLRAAAQRLLSPGEVLQRVNDVLVQDIPPNMFVTCLYAILDPESGRVVYANAGHDLPYRRRAGRQGAAEELRARGMPLGLMPGMGYEEKRWCSKGRERPVLQRRARRGPRRRREMFGFPRLQGLVGRHRSGGSSLISFLLAELARFTGDGLGAGGRHHAGDPGQTGGAVTAPRDGTRRTLAELSVPSEPGNERRAMEEVAGTVEGLGLPDRTLERLKTAVAEATMNAMEHGNRYREEAPVLIEVSASDAELSVKITDEGAGPADLRPADAGSCGQARRRADPAGLGALPHKEHGGRDERYRRRAPPHGGADPAPEREGGRRTDMAVRHLEAEVRREPGAPCSTFGARSTASPRRPSTPPIPRPRRGTPVPSSSTSRAWTTSTPRASP